MSIDRIENKTINALKPYKTMFLFLLFSQIHFIHILATNLDEESIWPWHEPKICIFGGVNF